MSVYKHQNGRWYCRVFHRGRELRRAAGATRAEAQVFEQAFRAALARGPDRTLEGALVKWLTGEAQALRSYTQTLGHCRKVRPFLAGRTIAEAGQVVAEIRADGAARGLAGGTVYQRCAIVRRLSRLAWGWGWIDHPVHIAMPRPSPDRHITVTPAEVLALAEACGRSRDVVMVLAYTGLRLAELWTARREGDWIRVVQSKAKRRMVPIHTRIAGCAIPPTVSRAEFRADWDRARLECGRPDLWARDLRHVCATMLVLAGVDLASVRDWLGHANLAVTSKYANLQPGHLRAAVRRLN